MADNLFPEINRSVSVRVTVVSLCTSEITRLSLAPPSDLIPPASLTISTASLAAATQPCPICAMLPVLGYRPPMFTGSAAQPLRGIAPNAAVAIAPPAALRRNSLRPCRFDNSKPLERFMYPSLGNLMRCSFRHPQSYVASTMQTLGNQTQAWHRLFAAARGLRAAMPSPIQRPIEISKFCQLIFHVETWPSKKREH